MNDQNNLIDGLNTSQILVGLDLGTKTIGVAVSDRSKIIATPLSIIQRKGTNKDLIIMKDVLNCLLYTSPSPRDSFRSRMPSSA